MAMTMIRTAYLSFPLSTDLPVRVSACRSAIAWFISVAVVLLIATPLVVEAQPIGYVPRVGLLSDESASGSSAPLSFGALTIPPSLFYRADQVIR